MDYKIIGVVAFFIILVSIQYTMNKILVELREIKKILMNIEIKDLLK
ncbi:hypothetical protein [Caldisalinibacter kiritimatiensis]|uniref:Uncharacterized protein n=1 Tax=Caldisalinibacter kiritimatiensis TaxID=1304284 RepID=R1CB37_9FIRM|nr:hypothetical protein [Caldisalinibacter kiritimatiensis]EOC99509.1 hypothetical protein L21TH_2514 [Caldisalinibacter kiritimatiensis]